MRFHGVRARINRQASKPKIALPAQVCLASAAHHDTKAPASDEAVNLPETTLFADLAFCRTNN